jgi:CAP12/Pycsar effector protein, TIR domain
MSTFLKRLDALIEKADAVIASCKPGHDWPDGELRVQFRTSGVLFLKELIGEGDVHYTDFLSNAAGSVRDVAKARGVLKALREEVETGRLPRSKVSASATADTRRRVFVVHGRNEAAREAMFRFLRALGLGPLEWSEAVALTKSGTPYVGDVLGSRLN